MVNEFLIIKDGLNVFHRTYGSMTLEDVDLTSGLFQALLDFSNEVGSNVLESIQMGDTKYTFGVQKGFTFVLGEGIDQVPFQELQVVEVILKPHEGMIYGSDDLDPFTRTAQIVARIIELVERFNGQDKALFFGQRRSAS